MSVFLAETMMKKAWSKKNCAGFIPTSRALIIYIPHQGQAEVTFTTRNKLRGRWNTKFLIATHLKDFNAIQFTLSY